MTPSYVLTIRDGFHSWPVLQTPGWGETPNVGDLVTVHPDGGPSDRSVTARVTGVQRVLKPVLDPPGAPLTPGVRPSHVAVSAVVDA